MRYQCFADRELCGKIIIPFIPEYVFLRKYYCVELFMSGKNISLGSHNIHINPFSNQFLHQQLKDAHSNEKCDQFIFSCQFGSFQICVTRDVGVKHKYGHIQWIWSMCRFLQGSKIFKFWVCFMQYIWSGVYSPALIHIAFIRTITRSLSRILSMYSMYSPNENWDTIVLTTIIPDYSVKQC